MTAVQTWHMNAQNLNTLQQLHLFIHQEHVCYSVARQVHIRRLLVIDKIKRLSFYDSIYILL